MYILPHPEQWGRVSGEFNLDHYQPQRLHRDRADEYDNLLYSCATCHARTRNAQHTKT